MIRENPKEIDICDSCEEEIASGWLSKKDGKKFHHVCFFRKYPPTTQLRTIKRKLTGKITDFLIN